jgi:hypothetical protein
VLASWREGETPESWKLKSPAVVIQDFDWQSGAKLNSFEIVDQGEPVDANLHCRVKLNFTRRHRANNISAYHSESVSGFRRSSSFEQLALLRQPKQKLLYIDI